MARSAKGATTRKTTPARKIEPASPHAPAAPRVAAADVFRPAPRPCSSAKSSATSSAPSVRRMPERIDDEPAGVYRPRQAEHGPGCYFAALVYMGDSPEPWKSNRWICDRMCAAPLRILPAGAPDRVEALRISLDGSRRVAIGALWIRLEEWDRERRIARTAPRP